MNETGHNTCIDLCKLCKKRSFSMEKGVFCGLTGEKPSFVKTCADYETDVEEEVRIERKKKEDYESAELSGFPAFYLHYAIPAGIIFSIVSFLISFKTSEYGGNYLLIASDIIYLLFYTYFGIYTLYAFARRLPDAVYCAKYQLIYVSVINLLVLIVTNGVVDSPLGNGTFRTIASIIWSVVFFISLTVSDDVKYLIPKEKRKLSRFNKTMIILSITIPVLLFIAGIAYTAKKTISSSVLDAGIKEYCETYRESLPQEAGEGLQLNDVRVEGHDFIYEYVYNDMTKDQFTNETTDLLFYSGREIILVSLKDLCSNPIFPYLAKGGYDVILKHLDKEETFIYSVFLTNNELIAGMKEDYTYTTDNQVMEKIVNLFSKQLPYDLDEQTSVENVFLDEDFSLHYAMRFKGMDMQTLSGITKNDLKSYLEEVLPSMSDAPINVATRNKKPLTFDFTADCSDWWKTSVTLTADDYLTD